MISGGDSKMELLEKEIQQLTDDELKDAFNEIEGWRKTGHMPEGVFRSVIKKYKEKTNETLRFHVVENEFLFEMAKRSYAPQTPLVSTYEGYEHIIQQVGICGGRPIIKGTRLEPNNVSRYETIEDALADWPYLTREQVLEAIKFYNENMHMYKTE